MLKHKINLKLLILVVGLALAAPLFVGSRQASAAVITCPDGFRTEGPISGPDREAICANHQEGGDGPDAVGCYIRTAGSSQKVPCPSGTDSNGDPISPSRCYTIPASSQGVGRPVPVTCSASLAEPPDSSGDGTSGGSGSADDRAPPPTIERVEDDAFGGCDRNAAINDSDEVSTGCNIIDKYVNPLISFLAAAVGLVVTSMIIIGGIQYSSAGGDSSKVAAAKSKIVNAIIALIAFLAMYGVLEWLIPGGLLIG